MRAAIYEQFSGPISVGQVRDPVVPDRSALIEVHASGICRSDWYGWQGYDADIRLPHVPGHEWAGLVLETGSQVYQWKAGDRVTAPFVNGCGKCPECHSGNQQVCARQTQPGFTHWGSFAQYVVVHEADTNLVAIPPEMPFVEAASLGCRFGTAYRAVTSQAVLHPGHWLLVLGCGGVGLSSIMIAQALGIQTIAVDIVEEKLLLAQTLGATEIINSSSTQNLVSVVKDLTDGGAHVSIDALGHPQLINDGILSLRKRGRHVQVGLMEGDNLQPRIPMPRIIADEIEVVGSHGIQAHKYPEMLKLIRDRNINLQQLISDVVTLEQGIRILQSMDTDPPKGVTVIDQSFDQ